MKLVSVVRATDGKHKFVALFQSSTGHKKAVKFGAHGMDDYTITGDHEQRDRYLRRHSKDLLGDPTRAGYLSYYILWGPSTSFEQNVISYKRKFKL